MSQPDDSQHPGADAPTAPGEHTGEHTAGRTGERAGEAGRIVVVTQDGMGVAPAGGPGDGERVERNPAELVEQPAKVMRIGSMIKQLLEEVRSAPLDEAGRSRLAAVHERSLHELEQGLAPELVEELRRIALPFIAGQTPSDAELRIAQAQLVGWLEGLFHGIQTALMAQQMAARAQLDEMRRALPPGSLPPPSGPTAAVAPPGLFPPGSPPAGAGDSEHSTGQYL